MFSTFTVDLATFVLIISNLANLRLKILFMYFHINAIGLRWVPGTPHPRRTANIVSQPPHVYTSSSRGIYHLKPGNILGRARTKTPFKGGFLGICSSSKAGIARNHLKVVSIEGMDTIDPSVVLQVYSGGRLTDGNNLLLSVFPYGEPPTGIRTINEGRRTAAEIGDTLRLSSQFLSNRGSYFVVVGLLVPPIDVTPFLHEEMKLLPYIVDWFDRVQMVAAESASAELQAKKLNAVFILFREGVQTLENMGKLVGVDGGA